MPNMERDKARESHLRRQAGRQGLRLRRSRKHTVPSLAGPYSLVTADGDPVGWSDLDLDGVERHLRHRRSRA